MPSFRAAFAASMLLLLAVQPAPSGRDWPAITQETKPWTRWWWHGSAVDRQNLTSELEALRDVGIGGVEITPIYGVRGEETRFIPFLSESWVAMLGHALREAQRLDLGVDMATGTGWPFGGPWIDETNAPGTISHRTWTLEAGQAAGGPDPIPAGASDARAAEPGVRGRGNQARRTADQPGPHNSRGREPTFGP